jgi:hypothetical protein
MNNVRYTNSVTINNTVFQYKVDSSGLVWIVDPQTGTEISVGQNRPVRNEQDAKEAAIDIITFSGLFVDYL